MRAGLGDHTLHGHLLDGGVPGAGVSVSCRRYRLGRIIEVKLQQLTRNKVESYRMVDGSYKSPFKGVVGGRWVVGGGG